MDVSFSQAILRLPAKTLNQGLSEEPHQAVDYEKALKQHAAYQQALRGSGVEINVLPALYNHPDSCFVEDVAIVTERLAVITRSGALSRQPESPFIKPVIEQYFKEKICTIEAPATLDGGDILRYKNHFFIGLSQRTNQAGAAQLQAFLQQAGFSASTVSVNESLHLKSSVSYLGDDLFVVTPQIATEDWLSQFDKIILEPSEAYAANCIRVNDKVIIASGYQIFASTLSDRGIDYISVDTSEYRKVDGGLSCLSLRF